MELSGILRRKAPTALAAAGLLILSAACAADATPTATPTPALTANDVLAAAGNELAALSTAGFLMIDETESGAKFFEMTLRDVEGVVETPASFRMVVKLISPGLGFAEIEMLAVGESAYIKFSADAPWVPLPLEQVPFNFGGIGVTLSELMSEIGNPVITGREAVEGVGTIRIDGDIMSEDMADLITSVDPGHPIALTLWFDETQHTLRQFRMDGQLYNDDGPETTRLVVLKDVNQPVDIQLPGSASGS